MKTNKRLQNLKRKDPQRLGRSSIKEKTLKYQISSKENIHCLVRKDTSIKRKTEREKDLKDLQNQSIDIRERDLEKAVKSIEEERKRKDQKEKEIIVKSLTEKKAKDIKARKRSLKSTRAQSMIALIERN